MSQKKVDAYKEEKKNRQQIIRREKMTNRIEILVIVLVFAALIGWFGTSVYMNRKAEAEANAAPVTTTLDLSDMDSFSEMLRTEKEEASGESEEPAGEEVVSESAE